MANNIENQTGPENGGLQDRPGRENSSGIKRQAARYRTVFLILLFLTLLSLTFLHFAQIFAGYAFISAINNEINGELIINRTFVRPDKITFYNVYIKSKTGEIPIKADKIEARYNFFRLFKRPFGQKGLRTIDIYNPVIYLTADENGRWNLVELFKRPKKKQFQFALEAPLTIHNGTFFFSDKRVEGMNEKLVDVSGLVTFYGPKGAAIQWFEAKSATSKATAKGLGRFHPGFAGGILKVKVNSAPAAKWLNYAINDNKIKFYDGTANFDTNIYIKPPGAKKGEEIDYQIRLSSLCTSVKLDLLPDTLECLDGLVNIANQVISFDDIHAKYRNSPLLFNGNIYSSKNPLLKLFVKADNVPLENMRNQPVIKAFPPDISGNVNLNIAITGRGSAPIAKGDITFNEVSMKNQLIRNGKGDFVYFSGIANIGLDRAEWENGIFSGEAYFNFEQKIPHFDMHLIADNANVGQLAAILFPKSNISARSDFDVKIVGTQENPMIIGDANFSSARYNGASVDGGRGTFIYNKGELVAVGGSLQVSSGTLGIPGIYVNLNKNYISGFISGTNFPIPAAAATATFNAAVTGKMSSPVAAGTFSNTSLNYGGVRITGARGTFGYNNNTLILGNASADVQGAQISATGVIPLAKDTRGINVALSFSNLSSGAISAIAPGFPNIPGINEFNITGTARAYNGNFSWGLSGFGPYGGEILTTGDYNAGGRVSAAITGENVELNRFVPRNFRSSLRPAQADFSIISEGTTSNLKNTFYVYMPRGRALGLPVNFARGSVNYSPGTLKLDDVYLLGLMPGKTRDTRYEQIGCMYDISTFWGTDTQANKEKSLLQRMYYSNFLIDRIKCQTPDYNVTALTPRPLCVNDPFKRPLQAVYGLPEIWGVEDYHQLKCSDDPGFPLEVAFEGKNGDLGIMSRAKAIDAEINGNINLNKNTLNLGIKSEGANLNLISRRLDLSQFGVSVPNIRKSMALEHLEGTADLSGTLKGPIKSPEFRGNLAVDDGIINGEFFSLNSKFRVSDRRVDIGKLELKQAGSLYSASGYMKIKPEPAYNFNITANQGKLSQILAFTPLREAPARGRVNADVKVRSSAGKLAINGDLSLTDAEIYNQPINSASVSFRTTAGVIGLQNMIIAIDSGKITGNGEIRDSSLDINLMAERFPLSKIEALRRRFPTLSGVADVNFRIGGTFSSPAVSLDFETRNFALRGETFDKFAASLKWVPARLDINNITLEDAQNYWNTTGSVSFPEETIPLTSEDLKDMKNPPVLNITSEFRNMRAEKLLKLFNSPLYNDMGGILDGKILLSGTFPAPVVSTDLSLHDGHLCRVPFDSINMKITGDNKGFNVESISFKAPGSSAGFSGSFSRPDNQMNFTFNAADVPVQMLGTFVPQLRKLSGKLSANGRIWGSPEAPGVDADVRLREGAFGRISFDEIGGYLKGENGTINLSDFGIRKNNHVITIAGTIPFAIKNGKFAPSGTVDVTASVKERNLDILSVFIPYIDQSKGVLEAVLRIWGTFPDIQVAGSATVRNGQIKLSNLENTIDAFNTEMVFNGKEFRVNYLRGRLGDGNFSMTGYADIDSQKFRIEDMKFVLVGCNMTVLMPGLVRGKVDTKITLTGNLDKPVIGAALPEEGRDFLQVYDATVSFPEGEFKSLTQIVPRKNNNQQKKNTCPAVTCSRPATACTQCTPCPTPGVAVSPAPAPTPSMNLLADRGCGVPVPAEDVLSIPLPEIRDFSMIFGREVWLDYKGLSIKTTGSLKVVKAPEQNVRLFGELGFSNGTYNIPLLRLPLRITEGTMYFKGGDPVLRNGEAVDYVMNPDIELNAQTRASGYDIFFQYSGDLASLRQAFANPLSLTTRADISIYSSPPLPRMQILQLLLSETFLGSIPFLSPDGTIGTGTSGANGSLLGSLIPGIGGTSSIQGAAVNALSGYLQGLLFNSLTRSFGRALSLSEFNFQYMPGGYWAIQIAKALDAQEKFFITYSRIKGAQNTNVDLWGLEYRYRPEMAFRVEYNQGSFVYSLRGQIQFDTFGEFLSELFRVTSFGRRRQADQLQRPGTMVPCSPPIDVNKNRPPLFNPMATPAPSPMPVPLPSPAVLQ